MSIDRTNWTALVDDDGSNTVGTLWTKDKVKTVLLDPIDAEFTARAAVVRGVAAGGTGAATLTAHGVVIGEGTGAVAVTAAGTAGQVLTSNGAAADPTFQAVAADATKAPLASPTFTGVPAAPTAAPGTNTTQLATTAFVDAARALLATLASPTFTGVPAGPTAAPGTNTTQLATTAFVDAARALLAPLASPALTGTPTVPTAAPGTNTTQAASTAFVAAVQALLATLASPTFTGTPAAPTAAVATNTTQLATTAYVQANFPANLFRASAFNSIAQVVATATFTVMTFDSESYDVGNLHSTSVNTGRLTVPAGGAGVYIVMGNWGWATSAAGTQRQAFIQNQAAAILASSFALPTAATRIIHPLFTIASLAVGDYVYLNGYQDTGGNLNTTAAESFLAMVRIG